MTSRRFRVVDGGRAPSANTDLDRLIAQNDEIMARIAWLRVRLDLPPRGGEPTRRTGGHSSAW